jgi:hypothetical protein
LNVNKSSDEEEYKDIKHVTKATILANQEALYNESS